jgi:hypothetical protein
MAAARDLPDASRRQRPRLLVPGDADDVEITDDH